MNRLFTALLLLALALPSCLPIELRRTDSGRQPAVTTGNAYTDILELAADIRDMDGGDLEEVYRESSQALEKYDSDIDRLRLALIHLSPETKRYAPEKAAELLQPFGERMRDLDPKTAGLVLILRSHAQQILEIRGQLASQKRAASREQAALQEELAKAKKKSSETARKLQELMEIDQLLDERQNK